MGTPGGDGQPQQVYPGLSDTQGGGSQLESPKPHQSADKGSRVNRGECTFLRVTEGKVYLCAPRTPAGQRGRIVKGRVQTDL